MSAIKNAGFILALPFGLVFANSVVISYGCNPIGLNTMQKWDEPFHRSPSMVLCGGYGRCCFLLLCLL